MHKEKKVCARTKKEVMCFPCEAFLHPKEWVFVLVRAKTNARARFIF